MEDPTMNGYLDKQFRINRVFQTGITMELPLPLVQTFLTAARHEGRTPNELAELANGSRSTVSRHLMDLSENLRNGADGYGLLKRMQSPTDKRSVIFVLTPKGKAVLSQFRDAMEA